MTQPDENTKTPDTQTPETKGPKPDAPRSQMVGEAPGEDLGYDPATIPTEAIPDDD